MLARRGHSFLIIEVGLIRATDDDDGADDAAAVLTFDNDNTDNGDNDSDYYEAPTTIIMKMGVSELFVYLAKVKDHDQG